MGRYSGFLLPIPGRAHTRVTVRARTAGWGRCRTVVENGVPFRQNRPKFQRKTKIGNPVRVLRFPLKFGAVLSEYSQQM